MFFLSQIFNKTFPFKLNKIEKCEPISFNLKMRNTNTEQQLFWII